MIEIDEKASYVLFVYPFTFEESEFEGRCAGIGAAQWAKRDGVFEDVWQKKKFAVDDLLHHIAEFLNPKNGTHPTVCLWEMVPGLVESPSGLGAEADWQFLLRNDRAVGIRLESVKLCLFCSGVGFVVIKVKATLPGTHRVSRDVGYWLDLIHYFRFANNRIGQLQLQRKEQEGIVPYFPPCAGGESLPEKQRDFAHILSGILKTGAKGDERWWEDIFVPDRMLPFAALYIDGANEEEQRSLLYRVRKNFHSRQEIHPSADDLSFGHPNLLQYVKEQWFVFSLDAGAFVAFDAPATHFFRAVMPDHLEKQYFLSFLLTLHQRFALMKLSNRVAHEWPKPLTNNSNEGLQQRREEVFRKIRDELLLFTARGYFMQVLQTENHHRCYRKWQETFYVEELYREVNEEVREMYDTLIYERTQKIKELEEKKQEAERSRAEWFERLGVLFAVPALIMGFLGINMNGITASEGMSFMQAALWSFGGGIIVAGLIIGLFHLVRRSGSNRP